MSASVNPASTTTFGRAPLAGGKVVSTKGQCVANWLPVLVVCLGVGSFIAQLVFSQNYTESESNLYEVENQWGSSSWQAGGTWTIGSREDQRVLKVNIESTDKGKTLVGSMQYEKEGPIDFMAKRIEKDFWNVKNKWGSSSWQDAGTWKIGGRETQQVIKLNIYSDDNGNSFRGTMTYIGEGPIGFRAKRVIKKTQSQKQPESQAQSGSPGSNEPTVKQTNNYTVYNQWGSSSWQAGGTWTIGSRESQRVISVDVSSTDNGYTLTGSMQYEREGPIGFKATKLSGNNWAVENKWGSSSWVSAGTWVIGGRSNQAVIQLKISSNDNGATFTGSMTYKAEGPIGFKANQV